MNIALFVTLESWNRDANGFDCPILRIPGAKITTILSPSVELGDVDYGAHVIRWRGNGDRPVSISVRVELERELVEKKAAGRGAVIVAVIGAIATIAAAVLGSRGHSACPEGESCQRKQPLTYLWRRNAQPVNMQLRTGDCTNRVQRSEPIPCNSSNQGQKIYTAVPVDLRAIELQVQAGGGSGMGVEFSNSDSVATVIGGASCGSDSMQPFAAIEYECRGLPSAEIVPN